MYKIYGLHINQKPLLCLNLLLIFLATCNLAKTEKSLDESAQFHFLIVSPLPIRMHIAGTFRSSLRPTLQDIQMKSVCVWRMGSLGPVTRAFRRSLPTHLRPFFGRAAGEATCAR